MHFIIFINISFQCISLYFYCTILVNFIIFIISFYGTALYLLHYFFAFNYISFYIILVLFIILLIISFQITSLYYLQCHYNYIISNNKIPSYCKPNKFILEYVIYTSVSLVLELNIYQIMLYIHYLVLRIHRVLM